MKRPRTRDKNGIDRCSKMNHFASNKISQSPLSSSSEQSSEEAMDNWDEAVASKDPSMYDNLLSVLGSGNDSLKEVYKWRQRELSGSDIKEDDNTGAESSSESEEDNEVFEEENSDGGQLLMDDHPTLFWTPCAAHCIDLMLHDICKLPIITRIVKRAIGLNGYIYNHPYVLNMMRTFKEQKELIRPGVTRFATVFLTLQSIYNQKNKLRRMFTSEEWSTSRYHRDTKGKDAYETVMSIGFWNNIQYSLRATGPLVRVLRLVDSEKKPAMGYIYEAMDRAKEAISKSFNYNEAKYYEIWEIIDKRWNDQLHRPLHAAGYYLNPEYFYSTPRIESNEELNQGFLDTMARLVPDEAIQHLVETELSLYRYARAVMGSLNAIRIRALWSPGSDCEPKSHVQNEASNYFPDDLVAQSEEDDIGEEDDASDEDHAMSVPQGTSSFNDHFGHILAEAEVDDLKKRKWRYKWEMPAMDMSMSKWVGTGDPFLEEVDSDSGYNLKLKLYKHWLDVYKTSGSSDFHTSKQRRFFSLCNSYRDILHCNKKPFYLKGLEEDSSIMDGYIIHALNHVFKTRDLVTKNDAKLAKHQEHTKEEILNDDGFLDQGFTRPKVLILLPFRSIALRVVKRLIQLTPSSHKVNVEYMDRFSNDFGKGQEEDDEDEISRSQKTPKPADHQALLGGNNDDCFMVGVKFTKRSIKLFSDFYSSDMIIASPVALITKMGKAKFEKENDVDYLSSIEILIIDHADVMTTFQKWSHLYMALKQLNRLPVKQHGTDVMRIRQWYLDGHAQFYRQTILLGSFLNPDIDSMFSNLCLNYQGKVKLVSECKGVLSKILLQVRQVYEQFDATSFADDYDARFNFFTKKVFPKVQDSTEGGTLIFISSYLEYVRLRNFFRSQKASFCKLMDFSKQSDISRARVWFFHGKRKSMLYTERAYFCYRYKIRGIKNLIIYSLPERKEFYPEIVNMLEESTNMSCTVLFSRFDRFRLERIVGTPSATRMLSSNKEIFVFS